MTNWHNLAIQVRVDSFEDSTFRVLNRGVRNVDDSPMPSCGSGFCVRIAGTKWVVTNFHVICGASGVHVSRGNGGRVYEAEIHEANPVLDLALLKVKDKSFWEGAEFGHLQTKMPCQNDVVYTIGFPSDLAQLNYYSLSINEGIVSALVIPGNSGGILLNKDGEILGVPTQIAGHPFKVADCIPAFVVLHFMRIVHQRGRFSGIRWFNMNNLQPFALNPASREFYEIDPREGPPGVHCQMGEMASRDLLVSMVVEGNEIEFTNQGKILVPGGNGFTMDHRVYTGLVGPDPVEFSCIDYDTKLVWETVADPDYTAFCRSYQSLKNRTRYAMLGGYLFFDVNDAAIRELFTQTGLPLLFNEHSHIKYWDDMEAFNQLSEFQRDEIMADAGMELYMLDYILKPIWQNPRRRGIMLFRSIPHESTNGNPRTLVSLVETCNNKPVKKLETLLKYAQTDVKEQPFLIIRCSDGLTLCIDKRNDGQQLADWLQIQQPVRL